MKTQSEMDARKANAKEWAASLTNDELEQLLTEGRTRLLLMGKFAFLAVRDEWNRRKDRKSL